MPQISVIVPVYRVEPYLHRCVDSILTQTFADFELILVDDGSPDNCPKICDEYARKDSRIHVIHQENGGLSAARNAGIDWSFANSNSQWITFIDSDDWVHQDYLRCMYTAVAQNHVGLCLCGLAHAKCLETYDPVHAFRCEKLSVSKLYSFDTSDVNLVSSCAKLYWKQHWEKVRFPVGKLHEDRFTTHKLIFQNEGACIVRHDLYYYFYNEGSIVHSQWTPKRLDDLEGISEQIQYFSERHLDTALKMTAVSHLLILHRMIPEIGSEYRQYRSILRRQLFQALHHYRKELHLTIGGNEWVYETLFPRFMRVYWICKAGLRKLGLE